MDYYRVKRCKEQFKGLYNISKKVEGENHEAIPEYVGLFPHEEYEFSHIRRAKKEVRFFYYNIPLTIVCLLVLYCRWKKMENIVSDKNRLSTTVETKCHHLKVDEKSNDILKVWVKDPTWLQVEQALSVVMSLDADEGSMGVDLNKMYRFMVENFVEKTEPLLTTVELLRLSPFVGAQLKNVLPNPFEDFLGDDTGN